MRNEVTVSGSFNYNGVRTIEIKLRLNRNKTAATFHGCFIVFVLVFYFK